MKNMKFWEQEAKEAKRALRVMNLQIGGSSKMADLKLLEQRNGEVAWMLHEAGNEEEAEIFLGRAEYYKNLQEEAKDKNIEEAKDKNIEEAKDKKLQEESKMKNMKFWEQEAKEAKRALRVMNLQIGGSSKMADLKLLEQRNGEVAWMLHEAGNEEEAEIFLGRAEYYKNLQEEAKDKNVEEAEDKNVEEAEDKKLQEESKMKNIEKALERDRRVEEKVRVIHAEYFSTDDEIKDLNKALKYLESRPAHKASNIVLEQLKKISDETYFGHNIVENGVFYAETFIMTDLGKMLSDLEKKGNISGHAEMENYEISDALSYEFGVDKKAQAVDIIENNGLSHVENLDEDEISPRVAYEILTRLEILETLELISLEIGESTFPIY